MKTTPECYYCLKRLVHQAAELATDDLQLRKKALEKGLAVVEQMFPLDLVSIQIATRVHRVVKEVTGNPDPYARMKEQEVEMAQELCRHPSADMRSFRDCVTFAVLGNSIDFFRDLATIKEDLHSPVQFAIDDIDKLEDSLSRAQRVLYLADNAGEVFFDLPLLHRMKRHVTVVYAVKEAPVQNDLTLAGLQRVGLEQEIANVITTGTDTPGIDFSIASGEFKEEFARADLVFAKGMGYYETLSELAPEGRVFYCLKAKCQPVADSLGVPLNSYVALLR